MTKFDLIIQRFHNFTQQYFLYWLILLFNWLLQFRFSYFIGQVNLNISQHSILRMQTTNHSGLQCLQHPNEQITNYCLHFQCLRPLCPDCVEIHTKHHRQQQIQSWKHCLNKSAQKVKRTLDSLRGIYDQFNKYQGHKSVQMIEADNLSRLRAYKQKMHKLIDDIFLGYEQRLRNIIRDQYRINPPDTTKLKAAIEELQRIIMKMGHGSTVLTALKKSLLLDHTSLIQYFSKMKSMEKKNLLPQIFVQQNINFQHKLREYLEGMVIIGNVNTRLQNFATSGTPARIRDADLYADIYEPIAITKKNYFVHDCTRKFLHFFTPTQRQLNILKIDEAQTNNWKLITFKNTQELPTFFQSIITPEGDIYLTGGVRNHKKLKGIYKFNFDKKILELVCNMTHARSSHGICYLNNAIYIVGGFSSNQQSAIMKNCQVFKLDTMVCSQIASLNYPTASCCATSYNNKYIVKIGGQRNPQPLSIIQIYSVVHNKWNTVSLEMPIQLQLLPYLSFCAAVQINQKQLLVFGGYNSLDNQKPEKTCYTIFLNTDQYSAHIRNFNSRPLPYAEAFWNNSPIIHQQVVYALQNVNDENNQTIPDLKRIVIFNGERWQCSN